MSSSRDPERPCSDQNEQDTLQYMKAKASHGLIVVVRTTQGGVLEYRLDEITTVTKGRIYLHSDTFYFTGKNCFHPKGQTHLLIPTDKVLRAAIDGQVRLNGDLTSRTLSDAEQALADRVVAEKGW